MSSSPLRRSTRHMKPAEKDIPSAQPIDTDAPPSASSLNTNLTIKDSKKLSSSTINPRAARFMPTRGLAERRVLFNPKPKSPSTDSPDTDKAKNGKKPKLSSAITTGEIELGASNTSGKKKTTVGTKKRKVGFKKGTKVVKAKKTSTDDDDDGEDYKDDDYEPSETDSLLELMDGDDDDVNVDDDEVGDRLKVDAVKVGDRYVRMLLILI